MLGLEQFEIGHPHGSSHGHTRLVRLAYYEHPDYVPLLRRAYQLWRELEEETSRRLLFVTGGLYAGPFDGELVAGSLRAARQYGLDHQLLDGASLRRDHPLFRWRDEEVGLFEPQAGFVLCDAAIAAHAEVALRHGAVLRGHSAVTAWHADPKGVRITTSDGVHSAGTILFTAGPWTSTLLPALRWPLTITRQTLAWVWPTPPAPFELWRFPCWAIERPEGGLFYGFPITPGGEGGLGLKLALHAPGRPTEPSDVDRRVTAEDEAPIRAFLKARLPAADGPLLALKTCLYTSTPDGHFVIDRHPEHSNVVVASPCSGHGFKFAPVLGEALADLVEHGQTRHAIRFLGANRLQHA